MPWLDPADVAAYAQYPDDADPALIQATDAAAVYVVGVRPEYIDAEAVDPLTEYTPPADVRLGSVMLAARWFQRRGTLLGESGYAEFGGGILRYDPDIARLLGIGPHRAFVFGAPTLPVEDEEVVEA